MNIFGYSSHGEKQEISKNLDGTTTTESNDAVLTLKTTSEDVEAQGADSGNGTKVRPNGKFVITAAEGYTIKSIELVTNQDNYWLTTSNSVEPTHTDKNHTYTFNEGVQSAEFTNNNSGRNIYVYVINVTLEYAVSGKQSLAISFQQSQLEGYVGDNAVSIPTPSVTLNGSDAETSLYTVEYKSNNEKIVKINESDNSKIDLVAEGTAVVTATVKPANIDEYIGGSAAITVVSKPVPALTVDVVDVTMNTTDAAAAVPNITVLREGKNVPAGSYTLSYKVTDGGNVTVGDNGATLTVTGTAGNWTAGTSTIEVTATPTGEYASSNKCTAGTATFTYTVNTAGTKLTPTIAFPDQTTVGTGTEKILTTYVRIGSTDITSIFDLNFEITSSGNTSSFTDTASGKFKAGDTEETVEIKITATPKEEFADQYNIVTKKAKIVVKELAEATITSIENISANVGDAIAMPYYDVTVNNETLNEDDYTVEYASSSPSCVSINTATGAMRALSEGTSVITIFVQSKDDAETAFQGVKTFSVIVTDPTIYTVQEGQNAPANGETVTSIPGVVMTYGGWVFNTVETNVTKNNPILGKSGVKWAAAKIDDAGALPNFPYAILGNDHQNPLDEKGANCAPEGTTVDYKNSKNEQKYEMVDNMFCVPAEGAYFSFAPIVNGRVTVHVLQNGAFDNEGGNSSSDKPDYKPNRRVFVIDETGTRLSDEIISARIDVTTATMPKSKVSSNKKAPITDITKYPVGEIESGSQWQPSVDFECPDDLFKYEDNNVTNFVNGIYKRKCNSENDGLTGGWVVLVKAPVTYSFDVKAGKTYYLYCFGSKLSLYGYEFKPTTVEVDEVEYSETETNTITPTAEGHVAEITIDREFKPGIWNACVLPFSLNKQQVDAIFGTTYDNSNTEGTQILYFDHTEGSTIHFVRHAYNTIVAGKPFLIKPSKTEGTIKIAPEYMGEYKYVTIESTTAESFGKDKETADYSWASSYDEFRVAQGNYFIRDTEVNGKQADGNIVRYPVAMTDGLSMNGFRGYLKAKTDALRTAAKSMTVAFNDFESGETTYIENVEIADDGTLRQRLDGKVYNLQGQLVSNDASQLDKLPKGIYVVNGTKVSVK